MFSITHSFPKDGYGNLSRQQELHACIHCIRHILAALINFYIHLSDKDGVSTMECMTHHGRCSSVAILHGRISKAPAKSTTASAPSKGAAAAPAKNAAVPAL